MDKQELYRMVRELSLYTMNYEETAGVIYHCFDDEDIDKKFGHLTTEEEVAKAVRDYEELIADHWNDIRNA
jgi:hypothetical protein